MSCAGKNAYSACGVLKGGASGANRCYVLAPRGGKSVATWQPGCQKFLMNQAMAESFWNFSPLFLMIKQIHCNIKEIVSVLLKNGHYPWPIFS